MPRRRAVPASKFARNFGRYKAKRRSFATTELSDERVRAVSKSRMDRRHDHLNALLRSN